tara:strand:- start:419 stop:817 length:399 start_codon:yes stop_codon:yes gene_type:complete
MATEILVNDGGAPARILPYIAGSTITAGKLVMMYADGQVDHNTTSGSKVLGVALTAATTGNICNVISGHGVQLNVYTSGSNIGIGDELVAAGTASFVGMLVEKTSGTHQGQVLAIALEAGSATAGLTKVQVI